MKAIIVDIDGTLANNKHRQHFMEKKPKDWKSFYGEMASDTPNLWCKSLITVFLEAGVKVILLSGRPDDYRFTTESWLTAYGIHCSGLLMRKAGDNRQDCIVKKELLDHLKKYMPGIEIEFVIDDRKQCVDMWRAEGLVCLQCAEGNF